MSAGSPNTGQQAACPNSAAHTESPSGYIAWHDWAGRMASQGASQSRCRGCGLYAIWSTPRKPVTF